MLVDRTGRKLKPGMLVDVKCETIMTGQVVEIHDSSIELPGQQRSVPYIVIHMLPVSAPISQVKDASTAVVGAVYIIADAPPDYGKDKGNKDKGNDGNQDEDKESNIRSFESGLSKEGKSH